MTSILFSIGLVVFTLFIGYLAACAGAERWINPIDWFFLNNHLKGKQ